MKIRLTGATFDASAKTVVHTSFSDVTLAGIQLIVNVTDQVIIYNFADTAKGGTLSTDTLTLEHDTTAMDDADELMILVEDGVSSQAVTVASLPLPSGASTSVNQETLNSLVETLQELVQRLAPLAAAMNSGAPALRTTPIASVSTAVTGTVTATVASTVVSSLTNFGTGIPASEMAHDINNQTAILANINNASA